MAGKIQERGASPRCARGPCAPESPPRRWATGPPKDTAFGLWRNVASPFPSGVATASQLHRMRRAADPLRMPGKQESLEETFARGIPLAGTAGQAYVERRGIAVEVADSAGLRYAADFAGRAAVVAGLYDHHGMLASVHGRYLEVGRRQDKMLTIGPGGGTVNVLGGWRTDQLILVEGLFDALSLAVCGYSCAASIGRWVPWIPEIATGRTVWLAFDAGRSGEAAVSRYAEQMRTARIRRMLPPGRSKDWNTALVKRGTHVVANWVQRCLVAKDTP